MSRNKLSIIIILFTCLSSCGDADTPKPEPTDRQATSSPAESNAARSVEIAPGLFASDIKVGTGKSAKKGSTVRVHATGRLKNGEVFWSSYTKGLPVDFPLRDGAVIDGWVLGVPGMREGGHRKLTIPHRLAYGEQGRPGTIPPRADLIFDIELIQLVK